MPPAGTAASAFPGGLYGTTATACLGHCCAHPATKPNAATEASLAEYLRNNDILRSMVSSREFVVESMYRRARQAPEQSSFDGAMPKDRLVSGQPAA
jgi:hypothetical protein